MSTAIDEIAPDLFRLSLYVPELDMQFNHFLVRDEEPLLFHTGLRGMFPALREAVGQLIDPATLRYIAWSHFESDECGALNDWLQLAPRALRGWWRRKRQNRRRVAQWEAEDRLRREQAPPVPLVIDVLDADDDELPDPDPTLLN